MTLRCIRLPDELVEGLKKHAIALSVLRGKKVTYSELVREAAQRTLAENIPVIEVRLEAGTI